MPITSEHLLFKFQIIFLGVNSVPAILGVYSLRLQLSHLICMLLHLDTYTLAHTHMCIHTHAQAHADTRMMSCPHHHYRKHQPGCRQSVCYTNNMSEIIPARKDRLNCLRGEKEIRSSLDVFCLFLQALCSQNLLMSLCQLKYVKNVCHHSLLPLLHAGGNLEVFLVNRTYSSLSLLLRRNKITSWQEGERDLVPFRLRTSSWMGHLSLNIKHFKDPVILIDNQEDEIEKEPTVLAVGSEVDLVPQNPSEWLGS